LLTVQVAGTWAVLVLASDRDDLAAFLGRAAVVAVAVHALANVAELGALLGRVPATVHVGPAAVTLEVFVYGAIPRLTGFVADPTRAGWTFLVLGWLVAAGEHRPALRRSTLAIVGVLIAATLSRSAMLGAATTIGMVALTRRRLRLRAGWLVAASACAAALAVALYWVPSGSERYLDTLEPLAGRFSASEASASEHVTLIARGLEEATSSPGRFALGVGYGNSYLVLQDVFPGNAYGNFHSLYVTMLAECGIVALLAVVVLLGWPLVEGGALRPLVAGAAVLNVFYQVNADPTFWLVLALAWMASENPASRTPPRG
ncbi:MAG TPA: O-antigen ligase family protein, partial [Gemmatimonadaceae bacterium]|nr:O-antigen ligase family protein [Gemmatimonadaceae bacterium]